MCTRRRRRKQRVHLQNSRRWRTPSQWARWSSSRPRWRTWTLTKRYNRIGRPDMLLILFIPPPHIRTKSSYSEVHEPPYCQTHLIKFVGGALWKCAQFSSWLEGVPPILRCVWLTGTVITTSSADWHINYSHSTMHSCQYTSPSGRYLFFYIWETIVVIAYTSILVEKFACLRMHCFCRKNLFGGVTWSPG